SDLVSVNGRECLPPQGCHNLLVLSRAIASTHLLTRSIRPSTILRQIYAWHIPRLQEDPHCAPSSSPLSVLAHSITLSVYCRRLPASADWLQQTARSSSSPPAPPWTVPGLIRALIIPFHHCSSLLIHWVMQGSAARSPRGRPSSASSSFHS